MENSNYNTIAGLNLLCLLDSLKNLKCFYLIFLITINIDRFDVFIIGSLMKRCCGNKIKIKLTPGGSWPP